MEEALRSASLAHCLTLLAVKEKEFLETKLKEALEDPNTAIMAQKRVKLN